MKIGVITPFPNFFSSPLEESIPKRAQQKELVDIGVVDLRQFTKDKHRQIDDYPYGGGPGMILKAGPFFDAVEFVRKDGKFVDPEIILLTPQGQQFSQSVAKELSAKSELILLCGHYKGVDERVREYLVTREISVGDYILSGGELAALVVMDAVIRLLPGVIGDLDSAMTDSFEQGQLDCPYYTRPEDLNGMRVPDVLLSGNHQRIEAWRRQKSLERTRERRSDLLSQI